MTMPPDDRGEQPGTPWPPPQYPPPFHRAAGYPRPGQAGYPQPGQPGGPQPYEQPGQQAGYPSRGYPETGQGGYPQTGYPEDGYPPDSYPQTGYPQDSYPQAGYPGYDPADYPEAGQGGYAQDGYPEDGYPPPGMPGYPEPPEAFGAENPPGYSPEPAGPRSQPALTALVLGILGLLGSFLSAILAIVFGIAALVRIRRTGQRGAIMAAIAIVLGIMWTALTVAFIAVILHNLNYGSVATLRAGSCFDDTQPGRATVRVHYLSSCVLPHNGEVVGTFAIPGTAWPGQAAVSHDAATGCAALVSSVLGQHAPASGVRGMNYSPSQQAWSSGTRAVSCVLIDPSATHTGSMLTGS
jgi:Domain of unknown function (DUF4190)/Septum formation